MAKKTQFTDERLLIPLPDACSSWVGFSDNSLSDKNCYEELN